MSGHVRGEKHPVSVLTSREVQEARAIYALWKERGDRRGIGMLADHFGVCFATMYAVITRSTWAHVPDLRPGSVTDEGLPTIRAHNGHYASRRVRTTRMAGTALELAMRGFVR